MTRFGQLGVYVKSITPETAASRGNIEIGDRILAINGKDVTGLTFKEYVSFSFCFVLLAKLKNTDRIQRE